MIRDSEKLKILQSIIVSNAVDVVDVFTASQTSPNVLLHDKSVFKAIFSASGIDSDVSAFEFVSSACPIPVSLAWAGLVVSRDLLRPTTLLPVGS